MKKFVTIGVAAILIGFISIGNSYADLMIDNFEAYNYTTNLVWDTWIDGWFIDENGSVVDISPFSYGGAQSMLFIYDNTVLATYSEAERTFDFPQVWTGGDTLQMFYRGISTNTGQLYVELNGNKIAYGGPVNSESWLQCNISLASFGVDLGAITTLSLGIDGIGATGGLYIDNIKVIGNVVPVPGAVLLGILGLSAAGIKLRKYA